MEMKKDALLAQIHDPKDLDGLTVAQLEQLAQEIRAFLLESVSKTGGHLASNLGVVELTLAIHRVFDSPKDKIVWDVGHQSYTHKILTGRKDRFDTLRQEHGLSGFPRHGESEHDAFLSGHSSNSISAAYGIAKAMSLRQDPHHVIAIIGDGSYTGGMVYEAMNNAGRSQVPLIVILNHNEMSISKNVGALAKHLSKMRAKPGYLHLKKSTERVLDHIPLVGKGLKKLIQRIKGGIKRTLLHSTFFEKLGFEYLGPIDGHDIEALLIQLRKAKLLHKPVVIQIDTVKGKGYTPAEQNPGAYHGVSSFDVASGLSDTAPAPCFSTVFGAHLTRLAKQDSRICAITAAMEYGTGLQDFARACPSRFFDVGIAEQHAVTFAAGLASQGMIPVFAVYSTFLQRGYDQIIHDCAIENQHVVFAVDRAGIVGDDGETHQGIFDVSFLNAIPNVTVYAPESYRELTLCLEQALYRTEGAAVVRYPRGQQSLTHTLTTEQYSDYIYEKKDSTVLCVTYGRQTQQVWLGAQDMEISLLKLLRIKPIPEAVYEILSSYDTLCFWEESLKEGGVSQRIVTELAERGYRGKVQIMAIDEEFVAQGGLLPILKRYRLDGESVRQILQNR